MFDSLSDRDVAFIEKILDWSNICLKVTNVSANLVLSLSWLQRLKLENFDRCTAVGLHFFQFTVLKDNLKAIVPITTHVIVYLQYITQDLELIKQKKTNQSYIRIYAWIGPVAVVVFLLSQ